MKFYANAEDELVEVQPGGPCPICGKSPLALFGGGDEDHVVACPFCAWIEKAQAAETAEAPAPPPPPSDRPTQSL